MKPFACIIRTPVNLPRVTVPEGQMIDGEFNPGNVRALLPALGSRLIFLTEYHYSKTYKTRPKIGSNLVVSTLSASCQRLILVSVLDSLKMISGHFYLFLLVY